MYLIVLVKSQTKNMEEERDLICSKGHQLNSNKGSCSYIAHTVTIQLPRTQMLLVLVLWKTGNHRKNLMLATTAAYESM